MSKKIKINFEAGMIVLCFNQRINSCLPQREILSVNRECQITQYLKLKTPLKSLEIECVSVAKK